MAPDALEAALEYGWCPCGPCPCAFECRPEYSPALPSVQAVGRALGQRAALEPEFDRRIQNIPFLRIPGRTIHFSRTAAHNQWRVREVQGESGQVGLSVLSLRGPRSFAAHVFTAYTAALEGVRAQLHSMNI